MVSTASLIAIVFTLLIALLLPIGLVIYLYFKKRISWLAVLLGALVFLIFQLLTRIPLLRLIAPTAFYQNIARNPIAIGLFLGLTAGIFEEVGRYIAMRFFLKGRWQIKNGVAYGLGHGGFEALSLIGITYINNLILSILINTGQFEQAVGSSGQGPAILAALTQTPAWLFAVAGLERVFALSIQVALSLVVLFAVRRGNLIYLVYAILLHTLVDFGAVTLSNLPNPILWAEGFTFLMALAGFIFIWRTWKRYETPNSTELQAEP